MKAQSKLFLAASVLLFAATSSRADIIYSQVFTGGSASTLLAGSSPDVGAGTWIASTNYTQNGGIKPLSGSATLAFTPTADNVYTLSATVTFTSNDANWIGMGFADAGANWTTSPANTHNFYRFTDTTHGFVTGYGWMITAPTTGQSAFLGAGTGNPVTETGSDVLSSSVDLKVVLDTTATDWMMSYYVNNALLGNASYTGSASIDSVGFTGTLGAAGTLSNFELSVAPVPEPSVAMLGGLGGIGMLSLLVFRRRKA